MTVLQNCADAVLVFDPAHVYLTEDRLEQYAPFLGTKNGQPRRVVLYCEASENGLRGAIAIARHVQCILVIRGVDDLRAAVESGVSAPLEAEFQQFFRDVATRLSLLPPVMRERWELTLLSHENVNVKRLAAECQTTRRTMERWFERCGLPAPAQLLRMARNARTRRRRDDLLDGGRAGSRRLTGDRAVQLRRNPSPQCKRAT